MRSTIRQVAQRAGVSRTTVSNVLLGRTGVVTPDKQRAVLDAVRELEYVPVRSALQNRHVPTRVFALSLGTPRRVWWNIHAETYDGMCQSALEHGYDLLTLLRPDPDWALDRGEVQFLDRRSDGFVFASPVIGASHATLETLVRHKIPTIVCYRRDVPDGVAWVDPDNRAAMFGAVEHLRSRGHTRIAHLTEESQPIFDTIQRRTHFADAMNALGLTGSADWVVAARYEETPSAVPALLALRPTAVVCLNDHLALELWDALEAHGLRVPEDVSLIGVDNSIEGARRGLTTMGFSYAEVGRLAIESLVCQIKGQSAAKCSHSIPVALVERASVRPIGPTG